MDSENGHLAGVAGPLESQLFALAVVLLESFHQVACKLRVQNGSLISLHGTFHWIFKWHFNNELDQVQALGTKRIFKSGESQNFLSLIKYFNSLKNHKLIIYMRPNLHFVPFWSFLISWSFLENGVDLFFQLNNWFCNYWKCVFTDGITFTYCLIGKSYYHIIISINSCWEKWIFQFDKTRSSLFLLTQWVNCIFLQITANIIFWRKSWVVRKENLSACAVRLDRKRVAKAAGSDNRTRTRPAYVIYWGVPGLGTAGTAASRRARPDLAVPPSRIGPALDIVATTAKRNDHTHPTPFNISVSCPNFVLELKNLRNYRRINFRK